jgi:O-antigen/teichoic acid export membrane protein
MMVEADERRRAGGMLAGVAWNALGRGLPLLAALALTPLLVHQLGLERWGLFTLGLAMVGVFGIFDFGVGQALTRTLAERIGAGRETEAASLTAAALVVLAGLSVILAGLLWLGVPTLVDSLLRVPPALRDQAIQGFRILALAAPLVVLNAALWGVLAAYQRFRAANLVTMPVALFYYLGPVLVLFVWDSFAGVMLALVLVRFANTLSYLALLRPLLSRMRAAPWRLAHALPLLRLGGWMSLSGMLTQALLYADRFLIGALVSLAAVAFYATPLDLVLRVWMLPVAVAQTLLPAFAAGFRHEPAATAALLRRGALLILGLVLPAALLLAGFGAPLLGLWLGQDFATGSGPVLRIMGVGILFSCLAFAPAALLDAIGRPDATARFALAQAVVYLPLVALALHWGGLTGAALAWALRTAVDCVGKLFLAAKHYPPAAAAARALLAPIGAATRALAPLPLLPALPAALWAGLGLGATALLAWRALSPADRALLRQPRALFKTGAA